MTIVARALGHVVDHRRAQRRLMSCLLATMFAGFALGRFLRRT